MTTWTKQDLKELNEMAGLVAVIEDAAQGESDDTGVQAWLEDDSFQDTLSASFCLS